VITATKISGTLWPEVFLYAPDGTREISSYDPIQARIDDHNLTQTGWYTIVVEDHNGSLTGPFNLCLLIMPGATSKGQIDSGQCKDGIIDHNMESYTFYGEANQAVVITATKSSGTLWPEVFLYAPDGTREISSYDPIQARIDDHNLTQTGWYTIVVEDHNGSLTGPFNLCLTKIPSTLNPIVNLSPQQGEITGIDVLLQWDAPGAISFDLYFGNTYPIGMIANDIGETEYLCPMLDPDAFYFWHVVAKYPGGNEVSGPYGWFFTSPCEGNFDDDSDVDIDDMMTFSAAFGTSDCAIMGNCFSDFDKDGDVDGSDLFILIKDFGRTACPN
jgi:hypothetical protein